MGLNQDENDENLIWKGCDTDSRQCRAYRFRKHGNAFRDVDARSHAHPKNQATSDDSEIFQLSTKSYLENYCGACYVVYPRICVVHVLNPAVPWRALRWSLWETLRTLSVHQLLKSRKGSRPCCNAALSSSPTRAKPFSILSEISIQEFWIVLGLSEDCNEQPAEGIHWILDFWILLSLLLVFVGKWIHMESFHTWSHGV